MKAVDNMRILTTTWLVVAAGVLPITCAAQHKVVPAQVTVAHMEGSLCAKPDQIVFSCPLLKNKKIVSICASGNAVPHRFYYVFGKPHAVEMTYPSDTGDLSSSFARARLFFAGATGGYAYSFTNGSNYKYILYSISGTGFDVAGVLVKRLGDLRALSDMRCESGKLQETDNKELQTELEDWSRDHDLEAHGLPHVPRR
jgi:hypothetical protein